MKHLNEEQLTAAYYGELQGEWLGHLAECGACRREFNQLKRLLDAVKESPVPERGTSYGGDVWSRLLPHLPPEKAHRRWLTWWTLTPTLAGLIVIAFVAGMVTQRRIVLTGIPEKASQRVLLIAMGNHLDRSQMVLAELVNADPEHSDLTGEKDRARNLVDENRLLRQTAERSGELPQAALLAELERVLLEVANGPSTISSEELEGLQRRIEDEGLLFKVRVVSSNVRQKGQQL